MLGAITVGYRRALQFVIEVSDSLEAGQMNSWITRTGLAAAMALATTGAFAQAQSTNRVGANTDWSVFVDSNPKECWSVSSPKETVNAPGEHDVAVKRGDILLFVFNRPASGGTGVETFTGGYPFASGSTVNMNISGAQFELFTDGEWAWPATPADDAKIITAMKRGSSAILSARSGRGTQTKDTFSLLGFTASVEESEKRCK